MNKAREARAKRAGMRREFGITVDGRTREAVALRRFRKSLVEHVGGNPSVVQQALIASVCQLRLRLLALDQNFANFGRMTETESRHYRGWIISYHQALRDLGLDASGRREPLVERLQREAQIAPAPVPAPAAPPGRLRAGDGTGTAPAAPGAPGAPGRPQPPVMLPRMHQPAQAAPEPLHGQAALSPVST